MNNSMFIYNTHFDSYDKRIERKFTNTRILQMKTSIPLTANCLQAIFEKTLKPPFFFFGRFFISLLLHLDHTQVY